MLLAERFALLALAPDGTAARGAGNQDAVKVGVMGALVEELVLAGHLRLDGGRVAITGTRPTHPRLVAALDEVARFDGKKLRSHLSAIRHSGWSEVIDGMVAAGIVGRERSTLRPTRHPVADPVGHGVLLAEVRAAVAGDGPLDPATATLIALAGPCQLLEVIAPERSGRRHAKRRVKEAAALVPVADAVRYTIEAASSVAVIAAT
jgi:hypothetical protein